MQKETCKYETMHVHRHTHRRTHTYTYTYTDTDTDIDIDTHRHTHNPMGLGLPVAVATGQLQQGAFTLHHQLHFFFICRKIPTCHRALFAKRAMLKHDSAEAPSHTPMATVSGANHRAMNNYTWHLWHSREIARDAYYGIFACLCVCLYLCACVCVCVCVHVCIFKYILIYICVHL